MCLILKDSIEDFVVTQVNQFLEDNLGFLDLHYVIDFDACLGFLFGSITARNSCTSRNSGTSTRNGRSRLGFLRACGESPVFQNTDHLVFVPCPHLGLEMSGNVFHSSIEFFRLQSYCLHGLQEGKESIAEILVIADEVL